MILQIKATKANGEVINVYPERDGDDQTDDEIQTTCVGWAKLQSELEGGMETDFILLTIYSHGEVLEQYKPPTQAEPAKVSKEMQARIKELYKECGRGAIFCNLETLGSGDYTTLKWLIQDLGLKTASDEQFNDFKPIIENLYSYNPETEYVLVIVSAEGNLDVSIYAFD